MDPDDTLDIAGKATSENYELTGQTGSYRCVWVMFLGDVWCLHTIFLGVYIVVFACHTYDYKYTYI